jgi:chemotaxis family two-component system response regulator Rcp1
MVRQAEILLVEDSPGDIRLTIEALNESKISNSLHIAMDGVEAMNFLNKKGEHAAKPTPDLILLDLNLPKNQGLKFCKS